MIEVGISEYRTAKNLPILSCIGLGSCVGICLYDSVFRIGGLAHVLLPDSTQIKNDGTKPGKFVDTAVAAILEEMLQQGAMRTKISAKLVGGASMFYADNADELVEIGRRNVDAAKKVLKEMRIRIEAEDVGGGHGRTIEFHVNTGKVIVKSKVGVIEI